MRMSLLASTERAALMHQVLDAHQRILHALHEGATPSWLDLDLSMSQLKALFVLFHHGARPISQVGASLGLGKPAASLLVDALVRHRLVERVEDQTDRRRTLAGLTATGHELMVRLHQGHRERFEGWLHQLSDDDLGHLARSLAALAKVAGGDPGLSPS